jgi:hypothetical protein
MHLLPISKPKIFFIETETAGGIAVNECINLAEGLLEAAPKTGDKELLDYYKKP